MDASTILSTLRARGLTLAAEGDGIRVAPRSALTDGLRDLIRRHRSALLGALTVGATGDRASTLFVFGGPSDPPTLLRPTPDRTAITMEANGWNETTRAREARWAAHRAACWERFIQHASVIQAAPIEAREPLLNEYQRSATAAFGPVTAGRMTATLREWLALPAGTTRH